MSVDRALTRIANGERDALEEVSRLTRKTVYYIALSILRERMLAEDAMQSTYLKVLAHAARYRAGSNGAAWVARIARNEAITLWRRRRREVHVDETAVPELFGTRQADEYGLLIDLARRILKQKEFAVLMLAAAEGYKRREIAAILHLPLATVTWHYGRAVEKMRAALDETRQLREGGGRMQRGELERELRAEADAHTPEIYDRVRAACGAEQTGEVLAAAHPHRWKVIIACVLAFCVLALAVILPFTLGGGLTGGIYISINPAVEFVVEKDKVTGVRALNRDAALLIAGEAFVGLSPEDAGEKFVALSQEKRLITADGVHVCGTGADGGYSRTLFGKFATPTYSSSERLFKEFLHLLVSSYPKPRMVAVYADKLHVTPKYLSAVCKEISGETASDIINQYVIKDVLYLLKKSEKSIKEIVNELDFPNLSFFGKYVKRYTGSSPKQYRKQLAEKETE